MIYSQAFRNEQFSPAVALFRTAGLIRTTAGIDAEQRRKSTSSDRKKLIQSASTKPDRKLLFF